MEAPGAGDSGQAADGQAAAGLPDAASLLPGAGPLKAAAGEGLPADPLGQLSMQPGRPHDGLSRRRLLLSAAGTVAGAAVAAAIRELGQGGSGLPTLWSFQASDDVNGAPVIHGDAVYFGTDSGDVYALRAKDGNVVWHRRQHSAPGQLPWSVVYAVAGGVIYVGAWNGALSSAVPAKVAALRASNGSMIWESGPIASIGSLLGPVAAVAGGIVCVGGNDFNTVYGLRTRDGSTAWLRGLGYAAGPVAADGVVYVGSVPGRNSGHVTALRASDGATIWRSANMGGIFPRLALAGSAIYVGDGDRRLYALRTRDGGTIWSKPVGFVTAMAVAGDMVYATVGEKDTFLYALRARDGATAWRKHVPLGAHTYITAAAVAYGVVYVGSFPHALYAFRASDGAMLWSQPVYVDGMAAANHIIYAGGSALYALRG